MRTYTLPKNLQNRAMREAEAEIEAKHTQCIFDDGDPNHPKYNNGINYLTGLPVSIFGYDVQEFIGKQYK